MRLRMLALIASIGLVTCGFAQTTYDARIAEKEVLTPAPAKTPRINGPKIHGARPGKILLYRIPTQGERPIQFSAQGLPVGLTLDAATGIITGKTPDQPGKYDITFTAANAHGKASRPFQLVIGPDLALTPPTGWNSWGGHMVNVDDAVMRRAADLFVDRGLADVGFQYVGIDDCWMRVSQQMYDTRNKNLVKKHAAYDYRKTGTIGAIRDDAGNILPNGKFSDMHALTDYIHARGLKAGIYSSPGVTTCQGMAGSYGHEGADADQYARWGFDLLKYDQCSAGRVLTLLKRRVPGFQTKEFWMPMANHLRIEDRDILFNLCQYGNDNPWTWAPALGIQTWRTGGDLNHHVDQYFANALRIATELREYNRPGHWNDPDFLYIHRIKDAARMGEPSIEIPLDTNQRYQYVTLWSIVCAPFFFSCDVDTIDEFTVRLLANADVLNLNQDELGHTAEVLRNDNKTETIMVKKLADGGKAVALFNRDPKNEATLSVKWSELAVSGEPEVFDVWRQKPLGRVANGISVKLSPNGVALLRLK